ncbi:MAG: Mut7-C RNAse domain-containing protein [Candidatus Sericytochromatia bacterium]
MNNAKFLFYGELNFFLPYNKKGQVIDISFKESPSVKDAIESLGIPHTEIGLIKLNDISIGFNYKLNDKDSFHIYPVNYSQEAKDNNLLRPKIKEYKFMVDANIGKMSKYLRMMGFDTYYDLSIDDKEIVEIAEEQERIILTRDIGMLKRKIATHGYFIKSTDINEQVLEVIQRFELKDKINEFSICLECNTKVIRVNKEKVKDNVPERIFFDYEDFYECVKCKKFFWKGSHYDKMINDIKNFKK